LPALADRGWKAGRVWRYAALAGADPEEKKFRPDVFRRLASHGGATSTIDHRRDGGEPP
jgi:hypothetical protein